MKRTPRPYLEPPPPKPEPSKWWAVGQVLFWTWVIGHMFVDFVSAIRWFAESW